MLHFSKKFTMTLVSSFVLALALQTSFGIAMEPTEDPKHSPKVLSLEEEVEASVAFESARSYGAQGNLEEAEKYYLLAAKSYPSAYLELGRLMQSSNSAKTKQYFDLAAEDPSLRGGAHLEFARFIASSDFEEAKKYYKLAAEDPSLRGGAHLELARHMWLLNPKNAHEYYELAAEDLRVTDPIASNSIKEELKAKFAEFGCTKETPLLNEMSNIQM